MRGVVECERGGGVGTSGGARDGKRRCPGWLQPRVGGRSIRENGGGGGALGVVSKECEVRGRRRRLVYLYCCFLNSAIALVGPLPFLRAAAFAALYVFR